MNPPCIDGSDLPGCGRWKKKLDIDCMICSGRKAPEREIPDGPLFVSLKMETSRVAPTGMLAPAGSRMLVEKRSLPHDIVGVNRWANHCVGTIVYSGEVEPF